MPLELLVLALLLSFAAAMRYVQPLRSGHRLVVDVAAAPQMSPSGLMWAPMAADARATAPFGQLKFTLLAEASPTPLCFATVYAAHGLPSDALESRWSCAPSTRTLELFEIETPPKERRRGHASALIAGLRETLPLVVDGVPLLWAKDASDVDGLYEAWGFEARDDEYPHVWALSLAEG